MKTKILQSYVKIRFIFHLMCPKMMPPVQCICIINSFTWRPSHISKLPILWLWSPLSSNAWFTLSAHTSSSLLSFTMNLSHLCYLLAFLSMNAKLVVNLWRLHHIYGGLNKKKSPHTLIRSRTVRRNNFLGVGGDFVEEEHHWEFSAPSPMPCQHACHHASWVSNSKL